MSPVLRARVRNAVRGLAHTPQGAP
jgi:hypothetical protein